jgi:hypothetical protein
MKKIFNKSIILLLAIGLTLISCEKDLNRKPLNDITADITYQNLAGYKQVLAKVYGSMALTGNGGPDAGQGDVAGIDQGASDFLRLFWNLQELSTDEAAIVWNDPGLQDFHNMNWTSSNVLLRGLYSRCLYQITLCNEFIRETTNDRVSGRGISGADAEEIKKFRNEARFIRAFQYWVLMDLFGSPAFVTESDNIGKFTPSQIKRADLFNYIEKELKELEPLLSTPKTNEYGRADQAAAWSLLARMYLNAEVYTGTGKYTEAIMYSSKVINSTYVLHNSYRNLFRADNHLNNPETILSINYDGINSQNYGGTTYLINGSLSAALGPSNYGVPNGGWSGMRSTKNLPLLFPDRSGNTDKRAMFGGNKIEMEELQVFSDGLAVLKFSNITSTGVTAPSTNGVYASTDFPLFRLAEMFLVYAESVKRGGTGGTEAQALIYVNRLRNRAFGNSNGALTSISLDNVLEERGRELYWEGFRRSDLIRYGRFTGSNYLWPWKGGVLAGRGVENYRNLYPIPSADIIANPNLIQNTGY